MNVEIGFGVPSDQESRVAEIFYEAFGHKFTRVFGSAEVGVPLISKYFRDDRIVVALEDGLVAGFAGLLVEGKGFIYMSVRQFVREFGLGVFKTIFFGWMFLFERARQHEVLVESLAVTERHRGKGIGSRLVAYIINYAQANGCKQVRLAVVGSNKGARRLYEKIGFKEAKMHMMPFPWSQVLAFKKLIDMVYVI